jgi:hypothetical protein
VPSDAVCAELENYLVANGYNWDETTTGNKIGKSLATKTGWHINYSGGNVDCNMSTKNKSGFF